jgi:hypothetical protein
MITSFIMHNLGRHTSLRCCWAASIPSPSALGKQLRVVGASFGLHTKEIIAQPRLAEQQIEIAPDLTIAAPNVIAGAKMRQPDGLRSDDVILQRDLCCLARTLRSDPCG